MDPLRITGGQVLLPSDGLQSIDVTVAGGLIDRLDAPAPAGGMRLDAGGLLVLPGIVDIHGDAFERQVQPRPGVDFAADIALADTESQLLANGITTAFHGITLSWEPGLRSLTQWRKLLDALGARTWTCDMRVHLRWEAYNLDALDVALADIAAGLVHLVAFNDHTPAILKKSYIHPNLIDLWREGRFLKPGWRRLERKHVPRHFHKTEALFLRWLHRQYG